MYERIRTINCHFKKGHNHNSEEKKPLQLLQGSPNIRSETFHTDFRIFLAQSPYLKSLNELAFKNDHQLHIQIQ